MASDLAGFGRQTNWKVRDKGALLTWVKTQLMVKTSKPSLAAAKSQMKEVEKSSAVVELRVQTERKRICGCLVCGEITAQAHTSVYLGRKMELAVRRNLTTESREDAELLCSGS